MAAESNANEKPDIDVILLAPIMKALTSVGAFIAFMQVHITQIFQSLALSQHIERHMDQVCGISNIADKQDAAFDSVNTANAPEAVSKKK